MAYTRVNWEDRPSTNTPINATNLNKMDKGIKDNYDEIQTKATLEDIQDNLVNVSNEVDEDYRVNFVKSKNLLDFSKLAQGSFYGTNTSNRVSTRQVLYLEAGTYTFSTNLNTTNFYFGVAVLNSPPPSASPSYASGWKETSPFTFTITTPGYVCIYFRRSGDNALNISDISNAQCQLEVGSTATSYVPHNTSIYIDNEEICSKPVVLWTNPSPTNNFASQTITMNDTIDNYNYYEIIYRHNTGNARYKSTGKLPKNTTAWLELGRQYNYFRLANVNSGSSVSINDCSYFNTFGSTNTGIDNGYIIPYQILGYK